VGVLMGARSFWLRNLISTKDLIFSKFSIGVKFGNELQFSHWGFFGIIFKELFPKKEGIKT
jgi:hypothetical protein